MGLFAKTTLVDPRIALRGRETPVLGADINAAFGIDVHETPAGSEVGFFALGCFWGEEKMFYSTPGVTNTAVGYMGGVTPNPTYEEVCSGRTNHTETVRVCFDPEKVSYRALVTMFFEAHDPTQGMRQGNDVGTQYRSAIYWTTDAQGEAARRTRDAFQQVLDDRNLGTITTELRPMSEAGPFYYAEDYHQQYLAKNPGGYCGIGGTGVSCPIGVDA